VEGEWEGVWERGRWKGWDRKGFKEGKERGVGGRGEKKFNEKDRRRIE
jgi:hypothetical protein